MSSDTTVAVPVDNKRAIPTELSQEINEGIDELFKESGTAKVVESEKKPSEKVPSDDDKVSDADPDKGEDSNDDDMSEDDGKAPVTDPISDTLLERAVKAGLSITEAREYPNAKLLESVCDRLENVGVRKDGNPGNTEGDAVDPLSMIPDLDPDEYDEQVVAGFKALKEIVKRQFDEIESLKSAKADGKSQTFFDNQVSGLDKALTKALGKNPQKKVALEKQFNTLLNGYKAIDQKISEEEVFNQAVAITLGDVKVEAITAKKESELRNRQGQFIARPDGKTNKPTQDVRDEIAESLNSKYYKK